jgi:hypothetical protein
VTAVPYGQHVDQLPEDELDKIRAMHAEGLGRNEIARRLSRSGRTITVVCADMGLSFDRTATEEATRARMADLAEKRSILAEALTDDALRLTEQLWQPATVFNIGGKDNVYTDQEVPEPPADAKRALMGAAGMAIDRSLRLVPPAADSGADDARSMLGKLFSGLAEVVREQEAAGPVGEEAEGESP